MSWEARLENFEELVEKTFVELPGLDLPVIDDDFGPDEEHDMLDTLIYDALLEEDFPPLPIVDSKIVQWIDRLDEYEEKELELVPDAYVQQEPEIDEERNAEEERTAETEERTVEASKVNKEVEEERTAEAKERTVEASKVKEEIDEEQTAEEERSTGAEERTVEASKLNKEVEEARTAEAEERTAEAEERTAEGQLNKLQQKKCEYCLGEFDFPVNLRRHKWRHFNMEEERSADMTRDRFKEYWEMLDNAKARKIFSIKDAVLPGNLKKELCDDIISAVSSSVKVLDPDRQCLELILIIDFLLDSEAAKEIPPYLLICRALDYLSDSNYFRGTLNLEMQEIVFPDKISMTDIEEQGLLASFEFLVEYCVMQAWAVDRERMTNLLLEEEAAAKKQMQSPTSTGKGKKSKPPAARKRKGKPRKQELSTLDSQRPDDKGDLSKDVEELVSSSQLVKESQETTGEKSSEYQTEQSGSSAAAQSNPLIGIDDSVQVSTFSLPQQEVATGSVESMKPLDSTGDDIIDGSSPSGKLNVSPSKPKPAYLQRKKMKQKEARLLRKQAQATSLSAEKERDASLQLKQSESEQDKSESAKDQVVESVDEQAMPSTQLSLELSVDYPVKDNIFFSHKEKSAEGEGKWQTFDVGGASKDKQEQDTEVIDEQPANELEGRTDLSQRSVPGESEESRESEVPKELEESQILDEETRGWTLRGAYHIGGFVAEYIQYRRRRWDASQLNDCSVNLAGYERRQDRIY